MRGKAQAAASSLHAEQAALSLLAAGGSAVDAVVGSFFATAGAEPGGLLCPVVALVAGVGVGARMIDGRCLQPGRGLKRPRGLREGEPVPAAADSSVSRSVAAALLLHAYGGALPIGQLLRPARQLAEAANCSARAALLKSIVSRGAAALRSPEVSRVILGRAGPAEGGLLTEEDLAEARPDDLAARPIPWGTEQQLVIPCFQVPGVLDIPKSERSSPTVPSSGAPIPATDFTADLGAQAPEIVVAADGHGVVAAIAYCPDPDGLELPELELRLPRGAVPVRRSVTRVRPGTPLPARAPIGIALRPADGWFAALGLTRLDRLAFGAPPDDTTSLLGLLEKLAGGTQVGLGIAASVQRYRTNLARTDGQIA